MAPFSSARFSMYAPTIRYQPCRAAADAGCQTRAPPLLNHFLRRRDTFFRRRLQSPSSLLAARCCRSSISRAAAWRRRTLAQARRACFPAAQRDVKSRRGAQQKRGRKRGSADAARSAAALRAKAGAMPPDCHFSQQRMPFSFICAFYFIHATPVFDVA